MKIARLVILTIGALLCASSATSQGIKYSGTVKDAENGMPIGYAAVGVLGTGQGVMTNDNGEFSITATQGKKIVISFIGYKSDTIRLGSRRILEVELKPEAKMLKEVVVKRKRYTNKNNPAVTLIRNVIAHKEGAHFYLGEVTDEVDYYIGINVPGTVEKAIIPESMQAEYGIDFAEPVQYVITGRESSWGLNVAQVTWIMLGVLAVCIIAVGTVMAVWNHHRLKRGYVPDMSEYEDGEPDGSEA